MDDIYSTRKQHTPLDDIDRENFLLEILVPIYGIPLEDVKKIFKKWQLHRRKNGN